MGGWIFDYLAEHPDGRVLNLSELSRDLGLSRPTIYRAVTFFTRFLRLLVDEDHHVGARPGRPRAYKLHPVFVDWKAIRAKRVNHTKEDRKTCSLKDVPSSGPRPLSERQRRWLAAQLRKTSLNFEPGGKQIIDAVIAQTIRAGPVLAYRELEDFTRRLRASMTSISAATLRADPRRQHAAARRLVRVCLAEVMRWRESEAGFDRWEEEREEAASHEQVAELLAGWRCSRGVKRTEEAVH